MFFCLSIYRIIKDKINLLKNTSLRNKSERKSNWQYIFIKENRLKDNGFHPVLCLERSERNGYKDVIAAMDFIKKRDDLKNFDIGFVSFCMGANSTIIAMSKGPAAFDKVKCMMLIQPISMEVFVRTYAKKILTPFGARIIFPTAKRFVNWRSEHPLEKMSPRDYTKDLKVPVLYVQARNDPWTDLNDILSFYNNTPESKEFYWIGNTKHRFESYGYFQDNPGKMLYWLNKWM